MFYPFNWFQKPRLIAAARAGVMEWLRNKELMVFLEPESLTEIEPQSSLKKRFLSTEDLTLLESWTERAWENRDFGGYTATRHLTDITGLCHFELNQRRTEAHLAGLIMLPEMSDIPPIHSPVLHLALIDLFWEVHHLQRLYLPFPATSPEDQAILVAYGLSADSEAGWWRYHVPGDEENRSFISEAIKGITGWRELSLKVEPELFPVIRLLLARHGFMQRTLIEHGTRPGPDGEHTLDETAPVIVRTYIPADEQTEPTIAKVRTALGYLAKLYPLPELQVADCSREEWVQLWDDFDTFRVGKNILVTVLRPDYIAKPGEIVVDINPAWGVFTPDRKGLHYTTILALEFMEERLDPAEHRNLLDFGTGSGVLSVVAAKMGVPRILGLDANTLAVESARESIEHNGVKDKVVIEAGSLVVLPHTREDVYSFTEKATEPPPILAEFLPFDAIVANTLARVLIEVAGALAGALRPGGLLITSGIFEGRGSEVAAALEAVGLVQLEQRQMGNWSGFVHIKAADFGSV